MCAPCHVESPREPDSLPPEFCWLMASAITADLQRLSQRSLGLDLLRVFAAAWVVVFHWGRTHPNWEELPEVLVVLIRGGYLGVDVFFLLSGAVIAHSALHRSWIGFARARFLRLFPAYFATATLVLGSQLLAGAIRGEEVVLNSNDLLGVSGLVFWTQGDLIIAPSWTLFHEVHFYMLVTVLIIVSKNALTPSRIMSAAYVYIVLWLVAAVSDAPLLNVVFLRDFGPLFLLGMLLGISTSAELLRRHSPAILLALLLCVHVLIKRTEFLEVVGTQQLLWISAILVPVIGIMLWSSLRRPRGKGATRVHRSVQTLALMTYPLYLLHFEFGMAILRRLNESGTPFAVGALAALVVIMVVSWLSVRYFEPIARRGLRLLFGWKDARDGAELAIPVTAVTVSTER
jgi:peptidoglycan/LPS O-acetylase OafA/YrhL